MGHVESDRRGRLNGDLMRSWVDSLECRQLHDRVVQYQINDLDHRQNASAQQQSEHAAEIACEIHGADKSLRSAYSAVFCRK